MSPTEKLEEMGCVFQQCQLSALWPWAGPLPEWRKNASLPNVAQDLYEEIVFLLIIL